MAKSKTNDFSINENFDTEEMYKRKKHKVKRKNIDEEEFAELIVGGAELE